MAFQIAVLVFAAAAAVAVLTAGTLSAAVPGIALSSAIAGTAVPQVPGVQTEEMVAAATDEEYDEAFAVFPGSIDPGSGDRYLNNKERKFRSIIIL